VLQPGFVMCGVAVLEMGSRHPIIPGMEDW
jgi:hypothetical protein